MAIIDLAQLCRIEKKERERLNQQVGVVWDTQQCGMEWVSGKDQVQKIDQLMALRQVDCPEIYRKIRTMSLENKSILELGLILVNSSIKVQT